MNHSSFLSSKVLKWSLPTLNLPISADAPPLKRLLLAQGELAQIYDAEEGLRYLAFIELRPGTVRGNHYHDVKEEWLYLARGSLRLTVHDMSSKERVGIELRAGDLVFISTGVAHALRVLESGEAVEYSVARFNPNDIHSFALE